MNLLSKVAAALLTTLFAMNSYAADTGTYNPETGYSCNNKAGFKYGMNGRNMSVYGDKKFYNGHTYREYQDNTNPELIGVRLSGHGIKGGLCFNSVEDANQYLGIYNEGFKCDSIKPLGMHFGSVGSDPGVTLAKNEEEKYGIRLSGGKIGGGLCFHEVYDGFKYLEYIKGSSAEYESNSNVPAGTDAYLSTQNGYDIEGNSTSSVHFMSTDGTSLKSVTWLK